MSQYTLWGLREIVRSPKRFQTMKSWVPSSYSLYKKVSFSSCLKGKVRCLWHQCTSRRQPCSSFFWWRNTVNCIYPWTHLRKTCFHVTSNVWVSGVKLWSFPAQMWSVVLSDFWNSTLIFAQLLRKNNSAEVLSLDSANGWKWDAFLLISSLLNRIIFPLSSVEK